VMSDFDERLSAVLSSEAGDAPPAAGLAAAARRRHVVRRRRRVAVGGVAAALAIAVPVLVLARGDGDGDAVVGADAPPGAWQTISQGGVRVEVPADWRKYTCDFDGFESDAYGPSEADACGFGSYLAFYASATFDAAHLPGVITAGTEDEPRWSGYVYADELAVSSATEDRDLTRRILASARAEGPQVEANAWEELSENGVTYEAPVGWGLDARDGGDYRVEVDEVEPTDSSPETAEQFDSDHYILQRQLPGRLVKIVAPTRAVAELVSASVARAVGENGQSSEFDGVTFELPADWARLDCPADTESYGPGTLICGRGEYLTFYARAIFDPAMEPGEVISGKEDGVTLWTGYVEAGDWAVLVRTFERQLTEDILASARP
jgi:hypothetical protein